DANRIIEPNERGCRPATRHARLRGRSSGRKRSPKIFQGRYPMKDDLGIREFLLAHGGPFYELQRRLGLLRENALRAVPRALLFVGLAWGVPLIISLAQGGAIGPAEARPFLLDPGVWARFFIAIGLF